MTVATSHRTQLAAADTGFLILAYFVFVSRVSFLLPLFRFISRPGDRDFCRFISHPSGANSFGFHIFLKYPPGSLHSQIAAA